MSSAGCFALSIARRTSGIRVVTPVEVSLWTTHTALIEWPVSAFRRFSISGWSAPWRQSPGMISTLSPSLVAIFDHRVAKWPVSDMRTWSPGESVLARAASQAPVPEAG